MLPPAKLQCPLVDKVCNIKTANMAEGCFSGLFFNFQVLVVINADISVRLTLHIVLLNSWEYFMDYFKLPRKANYIN